MARLTTCMTDFGSRDPYVAAMKGVFFSRTSEAQWVDLTHEIPPQDIAAGSRFWEDSLSWFPAGTVHLGVVDPGVGSTRKICVAEGDGQILVCPDNGLLTGWWRTRSAPVAFQVGDLPFPIHPPSATFHGRDVFTPLAAALVMGTVRPRDLGRPMDPILLPEAVSERDGLVWHSGIRNVDHFGNVITGIHQGDWPHDVKTVRVGGHRLPVVRTYSDAEDGALVVLFGSSGFLEIACVNGSAASRLGLSRDQALELVLEPKRD